jgi:hypothetical protein
VTTCGAFYHAEFGRTSGWKAREFYDVVSPDDYVETFELARGAGPYEVYSKARFKRVRRLPGYLTPWAFFTQAQSFPQVHLPPLSHPQFVWPHALHFMSSSSRAH